MVVSAHVSGTNVTYVESGAGIFTVIEGSFFIPDFWFIEQKKMGLEYKTEIRYESAHFLFIPGKLPCKLQLTD